MTVHGDTISIQLQFNRKLPTYGCPQFEIYCGCACERVTKRKKLWMNITFPLLYWILYAPPSTTLGTLLQATTQLGSRSQSVSQSIIRVMLYSGTCWLVRSFVTHLAVATTPQPHLHQFNVMLRAVYEWMNGSPASTRMFEKLITMQNPLWFTISNGFGNQLLDPDSHTPLLNAGLFRGSNN